LALKQYQPGKNSDHFTGYLSNSLKIIILIRVLTLFLLLLNIITLKAQLNQEKLTPYEEFTGTTIYDVISDRQGNIWMASDNHGRMYIGVFPFRGTDGQYALIFYDDSDKQLQRFDLPDDIMDKIFQPFFTTKSSGEGTGRGLSLSYDIIAKGHGGELKVESEAGKGSIFCINLPIKHKA